MKIALLQSDLVWENPVANRTHFQQQIERILAPIDLIVLPEMFTTGFSMNAHLWAETMNGATVQWLQHWAFQKKCAIIASLIIEENEHYYNRLLFVHPDGKIIYYDKKHLFTLAGESQVYTAGRQKVIINYLGWKICPLICYDLRFPVFSRNTEKYDVLLYVASWPKARIQAWDILLKARAIENMCYVVGVNRTGTDDNGYEYLGHSQAIDFLGNTLSFSNQYEDILLVEIDKTLLDKTRKKLPFLEDADDFLMKG